MRIKHFYLAMTALCLLLSLKYVISFGSSPKMAVYALQSLLKDELGQFFILNILAASTVLLFFILKDAARIKVKKPWMYVFWSFFLGIGSGLPAYLYARENRKEAIKSKKNSLTSVEDAE